MAMTDEQIERYSRHIILKEVGAKGQKKLLKGKVLIIGAGGLGAPAAMYLAAAGVGTIGIADADEVDLSNLQRQIIHQTADVGKAKVQSAKETINAMNPDVTVNTSQALGIRQVSVSGVRQRAGDMNCNFWQDYDSGKRILLTFISVWRNSITRLTSAVPASHSIPA